jgi:hypothetical protein
MPTRTSNTRRHCSHLTTLRLLAPLLLSLTSCGAVVKSSRSPIDISSTREAWNGLNDPLNLRDQYEVHFAALPLTADLTKKPWSDSYWPSYQGGLANRWHDPEGADPFTYTLHSEEEVRAMGQDALALLSPAEKYDIIRGDYEFPFVAYERDRTHADDPSWYGLCHGWAPASLNFREPNPVVVEGQGGVQVPFGSSDVKALLLYAQQDGEDTRFAGERCNEDDSEEPECRDINAGSFHVILANQIALLNQGFVAEVNRTTEVWNQPVFGFTSQLLGESTEVYPSAAPGTVRIASVRTEMRYIVEMGARWDAMPYETFPEQGSGRTYDYTLELNAQDEIIGGEWADSDHPDFVWTQQAPEFTGYFKDVARIYEASIRP